MSTKIFGHGRSNVTLLVNDQGVRQRFPHPPGEGGNVAANREAQAALDGWTVNAPHLAKGLRIVDLSKLDGSNYNGPVFPA